MKNISTEKISLLSVKKINMHVCVEWKTKKDDLFYFEIERFSKLMKVDVFRNTFGVSVDDDYKSFMFIDVNPVEEGTVFYRIKAIDDDSNVVYTHWYKAKPEKQEYLQMA